MDIKTLASIFAIALTFIGYAPYIKDVIQKNIRPHIFSWLIWGVVTALIFALQVSAGGGIGSLVTLAVAAISLLIFVLSLRNGNHNIKPLDIVCLLLAIVAIPLWLLAEQPVLSIVLLSSIDMLGFVPTIRKSWHDPFSETLSLYVITTFRHALSLLGIVEYNIITMLFPVTWLIANAGFALLLTVRRKSILGKSVQSVF